jgi:hypothetical protein
MKKIGIITYQDIADGKGRFLQAYALYSAITQLGYQVEIIDYYPIKKGESKSLPYKLFRVLKNPKSLPGYMVKTQSVLMNKRYKKDIVKKRKEYEIFIVKNIKMTNKKYYGYQSLLESELYYDAYVCGSDQIWNPYFQGMDPAYYLKFANKEKRVAYAPSLGTIEIDDERKKILKSNINEMPFVSVREESGAKLVSKLIGREVENVLDPTLLLPKEWWNDFAKKDATDITITRPYVLTFLFDNSKYPRKVAKEIARKYGYDIISIPDSFADMFFSSHKEIAIGPERFVNLFKNAAFICTQSFHGTVLSLIYNKQFYVFNRETKAYVSGVFSRINDLMKMVGLENRILKSGQNINENILRIDYSLVNDILEEKRRESIEYLKRSLEQAIGVK